MCTFDQLRSLQIPMGVCNALNKFKDKIASASDAVLVTPDKRLTNRTRVAPGTSTPSGTTVSETSTVDNDNSVVEYKEDDESLTAKRIDLKEDIDGWNNKYNSKEEATLVVETRLRKVKGKGMSGKQNKEVASLYVVCGICQGKVQWDKKKGAGISSIDTVENPGHTCVRTAKSSGTTTWWQLTWRLRCPESQSCRLDGRDWRQKTTPGTESNI